MRETRELTKERTTTAAATTPPTSPELLETGKAAPVAPDPTPAEAEALVVVEVETRPVVEDPVAGADEEEVLATAWNLALIRSEAFSAIA